MSSTNSGLQGRLFQSLQWIALKVCLPTALGITLAVYLHNRAYPPTALDLAPKTAGHGPIHMMVNLPGINSSVAEPLLVCGKTGNATMLYIRFYDKNQVRLGLDLWGTGGLEGAIFTAPASQAELAVDCYLPCLNKKGHFKAPPEIPDLRADEAAVVVNGVVRLRATDAYAQPDGGDLYFGSNPLGGSIVTDRYVGSIWNITEIR